MLRHLGHGCMDWYFQPIFALGVDLQPMLCLSICGTAPFKIQTARECPQPPAVLFSVEPRWVGFSLLLLHPAESQSDNYHWPASLHLVPLCAACSKTCRRLVSTMLEPRSEGWYKLIHCLCDFSVPVLTQLQIRLLFCPLFRHHPPHCSSSFIHQDSNIIHDFNVFKIIQEHIFVHPKTSRPWRPLR